MTYNPIEAARQVELEPLVTPTKVSLSVPLIAAYLNKGWSQAKIARTCHVCPQAVSDYIKRHHDELGVLTDQSDGLLSMRAKHVAAKAMNKIEEVLDETTKKDLMALNAISGTHVEKYRLLEGKSTNNIAYQDVSKELLELQEQKAKLLAELNEDTQDVVIEGEIVDNNEEGKSTIE